MLEVEFEQAVVDLARNFGWCAVARPPARTNRGWRTPIKYDGEGWPDLTLVHQRGVVIFAELKVGSNKPSIPQQAWGAILRDAAAAASPYPHWPDPIRYRLWHPRDADEIASELTFGRVTRWTLPK